MRAAVKEFWSYNCTAFIKVEKLEDGFDPDNFRSFANFYIPDDDMKSLRKEGAEYRYYYPVSKKSFPKLLERYTAMEAAVLAIKLSCKNPNNLSYVDIAESLGRLEKYAWMDSSIAVYDFVLDHPNIMFVRVDTTTDDMNYETGKNMREHFIPDCDTPSFPPIVVGSVVWPIPKDSFPGVLRGLSAMEAGVWAYHKCEKEHWEPTINNIYACLNNLEMDFV